MKNKLTKANAMDFPRVWKLFSDAIAHMQEAGIDQWDELYPSKEIITNDIERNQMFLLFENDTLASAVVLNEWQDEEYKEVNWSINDGKIAVLHRLCVNPTLQHKGFGKRIIILTEEELIKQGYSSIRLDAFSRNPYALKLYENIGYRKTGEVTFRKGKFYCFEKSLSDK